METMQAVSFMYVRPPGYNAESAKAAEVEDQRKEQEDLAMYAIFSSSYPTVSLLILV